MIIIVKCLVMILALLSVLYYYCTIGICLFDIRILSMFFCNNLFDPSFCDNIVGIKYAINCFVRAN